MPGTTKEGGPFTLMTKEELSKHEDPSINALGGSMTESSIAFTPTKLLPHSSKMVLHIGPSIPSSEGPLLSEKHFKKSYQTMKPLSVEFLRGQGGVKFLGGQGNVGRGFDLRFNQPLVYNNQGIDDLKWRPKISPDIPGVWKLSFGNKILIFTAKDDLPLSTTIEVKVEAGVSSIYGSSLEEDSINKISTPTIAVRKTFPSESNGTQSTRPVIVVSFDQRIDVEKMLSSGIKLWTKKSESQKNYLPLELVSEKELSEIAKEDESLNSVLSDAQEGKFIACRPVVFLSLFIIRAGET